MSIEIKLSEIRQIAITVSDVSTSLPFYRDVLGLSFLFSPAPTLAFLAAGPVRIMLTTPQGAGTVGHNSILYFKVSDIAATHAAIVGRGAKEERGPQLTVLPPGKYRINHYLWDVELREAKEIQAGFVGVVKSNVWADIDLGTLLAKKPEACDVAQRANKNASDVQQVAAPLVPVGRVAGGVVSNIVIADYVSIPWGWNIWGVQGALSIGQQTRDAIENINSGQVAREIMARLPKNDGELDALLKRGYELARMMSWEVVARDYLLPSLHRA